MCDVIGPSVVSHDTAKTWFGKFKNDAFDLSDKGDLEGRLTPMKSASWSSLKRIPPEHSCAFKGDPVQLYPHCCSSPSFGKVAKVRHLDTSDFSPQQL